MLPSRSAVSRAASPVRALAAVPLPRVSVPLLALLFAAVLLAAPAVSGQEGAGRDGRPFEIADYYRTAFLGAPVVSPEGSRVAFVVSHQDLEAGESWSHVWTMGPDGTQQRQMTRGRHHDGGPVFSPDGKTLLFTSDRGGSSNLWVMPVDGGEPKQLTRFPAALEDPAWSPDGRWLAVTAEVFPECGADADCHREILEGLEEGPLNVHVAEELLYRHWTAWRDGRFRHVLLVDAKTGEVVRDLTPGPFDSPVFSLGGDRGYDFSPDGRWLVYVANREARAAESTNADLWLVDLRTLAGQEAPGGAADETPAQVPAVNLTASNRGWDGSPRFSPDGRRIAYRSQETPAYEADLFRLTVLELPGDGGVPEVRYLTDRDGFDQWVDELAWSADGETLYFQAEVRGRTPLYRIPAAGGEPRELFTHAYLGGWKVLPGDDAVIYNRRAIAEPPEIFRRPLAGGEPTRLTRFNAELEAEVDIRPAEEMWVQGEGDYRVHVFVIKPHGFDPTKKYPLILNVHGGPQQMWADSFRGDWQVYPAKGYVVAFANPTGSPGYGQDFVDAIGCDWGGRVYRDLMKVTDHLEALPWVDGERMGSMGWSYGGYMMMWFQGHTDRFAAQVAMMGIYDLPSMYGATEELWFVEKDLCGTPWTSEDYRRWSPFRFVEGFSTPALVITGELDYRVPYTQSLQYFTALQKRDVASRLIVFPDAGHWPSWYEMAFYYNAHLDWFHRWLGGGEAPWDVMDFARNRAFGPLAQEAEDAEKAGAEAP